MKLSTRRSVIVITLLLLLVALALGGIRFNRGYTQSPVPAEISRQAGFPVYYPEKSELPAGYALDAGSFSTAQDVVIYTVKYKGGTLVVSEQPKPSADDLTTFHTQRIPIHIEFKTKLGTARLGIIGQQAIVSLPTSDNVWILVTGPNSLLESDIAPVLAALRK